MPANITDVDEFTDPIVIPADADPADRTYIVTLAQGLANRTRHLFTAVLGSLGFVTLPTAFGKLRYLAARSVADGGSGFPSNYWTLLDTGGYLTNSNNPGAGGARRHFDLTRDLYRHESISKVYVLVSKGAARSGTDRMRVELTGVSYGISLGSPTGPTATSYGDEYDDGTSGLEWIEIDLVVGGVSQPVSDEVTWLLRVTSGHDSKTNVDAVHAVAVQVSTTQIGSR